MYTTLPAVLVTVLTVVSPLITAIFTHVSMDSTAKKNIAFGVSLVIATVYVVLTGGIHDITNLAEIAGAAPIIFTLQQLIFGNMLQKLSGVIEAKVGVKAPAVAPAAAPAAPGPNITVNVTGPVSPQAIAGALGSVLAAGGGTPVAGNGPTEPGVG